MRTRTVFILLVVAFSAVQMQSVSRAQASHVAMSPADMGKAMVKALGL